MCIPTVGYYRFGIIYDTLWREGQGREGGPSPLFAAVNLYRGVKRGIEGSSNNSVNAGRYENLITVVILSNSKTVYLYSTW